MRKIIELIVPCYNEETCISLFYNRIKEVFQEKRLSDYDYLITFVDDGSKDNTLFEIKKTIENTKDKSVQYISLSRNFGKESAMFAGLSKSTGDYVAVLDADLQHPPELLTEMLDAIEKEGYDCASARRVSRKGEPPIRNFFSKMFYRVINKITDMDLVQGSTDYRLMTRKVVEAIVSMPEYERFTKGIYSWIGFKNKWIPYENVERVAGQTTWNFGGLIRYAYSGFLAFATTPLRWVMYLGGFVVVLSFVFAVYTVIEAINKPDVRTGYSTIVCVLLFLGGVIITILGVLGEYLARIYMEVKRRPIYLTRETNISNKPEIISKEEILYHNKDNCEKEYE